MPANTTTAMAPKVATGQRAVPQTVGGLAQRLLGGRTGDDDPTGLDTERSLVFAQPDDERDVTRSRCGESLRQVQHEPAPYHLGRTPDHGLAVRTDP